MKAPWRPRVSGISGYLCGPVAAALITFINLRRLGEHRKAVWTLVLTVLGCMGFGVAVALLPEATSGTLAKMIAYVASPILYPALQNRAFDDWLASQPQAQHDSGWRSSGWAILGLAAFLVIAIGPAVAISWNSEAHDIEVRYSLPDKANVGEAFEFTIAVENTADRPQLLHSIDVDARFLEGISIESSSPAFRKSEPNMLAPIRSYIYTRTIPPKKTLEIDVQGHAMKAGAFPLNVDVCVKTALACSSFTLKTIIIQ